MSRRERKQGAGRFFISNDKSVYRQSLPDSFDFDIFRKVSFREQGPNPDADLPTVTLSPYLLRFAGS